MAEESQKFLDQLRHCANEDTIDSNECLLFMTNIKRVQVYMNMPTPLKEACLDNGMTELCVPFASVLIAARAVSGEKDHVPSTQGLMNASKPLIKDLLEVKGLSPDLQSEVEKAGWDFVNSKKLVFDKELYPYAIYYTVCNPLPRF